MDRVVLSLAPAVLDWAPGAQGLGRHVLRKRPRRLFLLGALCVLGMLFACVHFAVPFLFPGAAILSAKKELSTPKKA